MEHKLTVCNLLECSHIIIGLLFRLEKVLKGSVRELEECEYPTRKKIQVCHYNRNSNFNFCLISIQVCSVQLMYTLVSNVCNHYYDTYTYTAQVSEKEYTL